MAKSTYAASHFQNDDDARIMLESILWPAGPVCPHCGVVGHSYATKRAGVYRCAGKACRKDFTVTMRTVMERSKIALHKWLQAFHLVTSSKKGVSAHQLHRTLNIGYEAAWFMHHRIREAMRDGGLGVLGGPNGSGIVEADETYYGKMEKPRVSPQRKARPTRSVPAALATSARLSAAETSARSTSPLPIRKRSAESSWRTSPKKHG